ncbi:unnamed protein product, partial [Amoebophrya sp. A25]
NVSASSLTSVRTNNNGLPSISAVGAAIRLFREGSEIPFIARYRKVPTEHMGEGALRIVKRAYTSSDDCERRRGTIFLTLQKRQKQHIADGTKTGIDRHVLASVRNARNLEELEEIYSPYKDGQQTMDKAARARELGL